MAESLPKKQACHGSCHCGFTQYIVFLTLPHPYSASNPPRSVDQEIYRCNCSTCHKMNFFHVHPADPRTDFMLLSPLDPDRDLSTYQWSTRERKYYFCPKCGVRCLTFSGAGEVEAVDASELGDDKRGRRDVWRVKWDGEDATRPYVAVNGVTIDYREDLDFRLLTEEKRVQYFDGRSDPDKEKPPRWDRPHYGGCY